MSILAEIVANKRDEVSFRKLARPLPAILMQLHRAAPTRDFRAALSDPSKHAPRVIAEIKRRSPSKGALRPDLDPAQVASIYQRNGAAALSVLADSRYFGGSLDDLAVVSMWCGLPVLCKEFIVDAYQVYEARMAGADAVLLLASVLSMEQLRDFREITESLGMAALVEVHSELELFAALQSGATLVGINNRDLRTFEVSLDTTRRLLPLIPAGVVTVSESGIRDTSDRETMLALGVDALLIGEGLLASPDLAAATRQMCGQRAPALVAAR
ncbi:MAG TPA: indole-3-glycerol phosphate synthase TrpC [Chloroflexia bacterium]|jgi:indole-3-glycerol phosphate synthase